MFSGVQIRIKKIQVEQLFGIYNYTLEQSENSNFMIFYGDNGCGKTTILSLLYHLMNSEERGGHRTAIGSIPFLLFSVFLSDGKMITAKRESVEDPGYKILFEYNNTKIVYFWSPVESNSSTNKKNYTLFCRYLTDLRINPLFLSANRRIYDEYEERNNRVYRINRYNEDITEMISNRNIDDELTLSQVVDQFQRWIHGMIISSTNEGNKTIGEHYLGIIRNIKSFDKKKDVNLTKERIRKLIHNNQKYIQFGLSTDLFSDEFRDTINSLDEKEWLSVRPVLESYLSSIELRLDALSFLQSVLQKLELYFSNLFKDKSVSINAGYGIAIASKNGVRLELKNLSSGERQFLYLVCRVITSINNSSIILMDEPEISLNIKWQRDFLDVLNSLIGKNKTQIIIATHSLEMITPYLSSVVQLK